MLSVIPAVFGKKIGGDILCGKKTFLVHAATAQMTPEEAQTFLQKLSTPVGDASGLYSTEEEKISDIMAVYIRYKRSRTLPTAHRYLF